MLSTGLSAGLRRWKATLAVLTLTIPALSSISPAGEQAPVLSGIEPPKVVYRRPLATNPATLDPARINDIYGRTIANQLFDGLVEFDGALAIRPAIAETWTASRDGLEWTFTLRKGVKFHNGREVTAADFVYSPPRAAAPWTGGTGLRRATRRTGSPAAATPAASPPGRHAWRS